MKPQPSIPTLDAVQKTFFRLYKVKPSKIVGHDAAWLYRICRSRVLDLIRNAKTIPRD